MKRNAEAGYLLAQRNDLMAPAPFFTPAVKPKG